jgi:ribosomal protein L13
MYGHFSGYAGGLRLTSFREKLKADPVGLFTLAVKRMLPDNRTRKILLTRLTVKP